MAWPAVGVFVGGRGLRMGGVAKGLLLHDGVPLIERVLSACRAAAHPHPLEQLYLVGDAAPYAMTGVPSLADAPAGVGPIGGLRALLLLARERGVEAVAVAVDLPYLGPGLVRRVCLEQPGAAALAPRQEGRWQPLFARYQPDAVLPVLEAALAAGQTALQAIFQGLAARPLDAATVGVPPAGGPRELRLAPDDELALRDWDTPGDMSDPAPTS